MYVHPVFNGIVAFLAVFVSTGFATETGAPTVEKIISAWRKLLDNSSDYSMVIENRDGSGVVTRTDHLMHKGESGAAVSYFSTATLLHLLNEKYAAVATNLNGGEKGGLGELRRTGWELKEVVVRSPETAGDNLTAELIQVAGPITLRTPWESHAYISLLEEDADSALVEQLQNGGVRVRVDKNSTDDPNWPNVRSADLELDGEPNFQLREIAITNRDGGETKNSYTYKTIDGIPQGNRTLKRAKRLEY